MQRITITEGPLTGYTYDTPNNTTITTPEGTYTINGTNITWTPTPDGRGVPTSTTPTDQDSAGSEVPHPKDAKRKPA